MTYNIQFQGGDGLGIEVKAAQGKEAVVLRFKFTVVDSDPFAIERLLSGSMGKHIQAAAKAAPIEMDRESIRVLKGSERKYGFFDCKEVELVDLTTQAIEKPLWVMMPARFHFFDLSIFNSLDRRCRINKNPTHWDFTCRYSLRAKKLVPDYQGILEAGKTVTIECLYCLPYDWHRRSYVLRYGNNEPIPVKLLRHR